MLKTVLVHLLGGVIAVALKEAALLLPGGLQTGAFIVMSVLMAAYYIWVGAFLKNESLHKVIALMQTFTFLGHRTYIFGTDIYNRLVFLAGGSSIWNLTIGKISPAQSSLSNTPAYVFMFFVFPVFIASGRLIAGKLPKPDIKKEGTFAIKIILCRFAMNAVYIIASAFMEGKPKAETMPAAGIAVAFMVLIGIAGGVILRKIRWSKVYFYMTNISFFGIAFCLYLSQTLLITLSGSELMLSYFYKLIFRGKTELSAEIFILPFFVLIGQIIGNKLIKEKTPEETAESI